MSVTFTKLFSSITESTVWCEPDRTRLVWITMLAMADRHGRIWASIPGLANRARVPVEDCRAAVDTLLAPDRDSRTPDHEGRRIEAIDGGWRLLNHAKYRAVRDEESAKEAKRKYINARREREREISTVERGRDNAEADTEAEADIRKSKALASPDEESGSPVGLIPLAGKKEWPVPQEFVTELESAYPSVDGVRTLREIRAWCVSNPEKLKTARGVKRFINRWFEKEQNRG